MFCSECGKKLKKEEEICSSCGYNPNEVKVKDEAETPIGWAILCFFIPLIGLILFIVWHKERPRVAKYSGIGAIIGTAVSIIFSVIFSIFFLTAIIENVDDRLDYDYPYNHRYNIYD